ncbi:MAG: NADPH:quinone oxidoreductase family protein [Candidimonas sp.]|nr:NADPH:quinone oxidoreductase family protein [Candidimonas sp.]
MKAVMIKNLEGPDHVDVVDVADPIPKSGEVLISVRAAGISFPELLQTRGLYQEKPDLPFIPGYEVAGLVEDANGCQGFAVGDRVVGFTKYGGYAEKAAIRAEWVFPLPQDLPFAKAAALPMNYLTAHFSLMRRGGLRQGESVLVHGAGGGVGTASIQIAKSFGASCVIAVVSNAAKADAARTAGADEVVDANDFLAQVLALTDSRGVDIVVDPVGGDRFTDSLRALAPFGRVLVIGFAAGAIPTVKVNRLLLKNIDVVGAGWGSYAWDAPGYLSEQWAELIPHIESGMLDPVVGAEYPVARIRDALKDLDARRVQGKSVLIMDGNSVASAMLDQTSSAISRPTTA